MRNPAKKEKGGSKSVEEYHKDIEVALMRTNVLESKKRYSRYSGTVALCIYGQSGASHYMSGGLTKEVPDLKEDIS
ncbi:hypothetical protein CR513_00335, partial [Mucuna pruriens]